METHNSKWKNAALYPPPTDKVLKTKDAEGKEYILKFNGKLFTRHGRGILPQPIYWWDTTEEIKES